MRQPFKWRPSGLVTAHAAGNSRVTTTSMGRSKTFSPMMLGKVVEGVWHTSVVVFNKEYYFQGGISIDQPKTTPFGIPVKTISIGTTELTEADLNEFLIDVKPQYTPESYNIFDHNCNH